MEDKIQYFTIKELFSDFDKHCTRVEYMDMLRVTADAHIKKMFMVGCEVINPDSECLLSITDNNYIAPTKQQVQCVVNYLVETLGVSKTEISIQLGVTAKGNRTLNSWLGSSRDQQIPYTAWRKLLSLAGLSIDLMVLSERTQLILAKEAKELTVAENNGSELALLQEAYNVLDHGTADERLYFLNKLKQHFNELRAI
ncbi:hypothetical protein [Photobacterium andalusiense]|uniref:Uncharacterized protein n=1 Tax=Photobacterium andalusiense TaxID=2204296 RepID=A0A1Y6MNM8_9GAMM|nr:hypothetical protein [Photobacterium andalusiense]SMY38207.1 hypothetical protein PAND9192_03498 [Photobacterium andalusiense]